MGWRVAGEGRRRGRGGVAAGVGAWLAACGQPAPLPERPVIAHALEEQQQVVEDALAAMRSEVPEGRFPRVDLIDFVVVEDTFEWWGTWSGEERTIRLDHGLDGRLLADVVRHEVCHAIDEQSAFGSAQRAWPSLPIPTWDGSDGARRKELFADLCGLGVEGLALLRTVGRSCVDDELAAVADEVGEWVYPASAARPTVAPAVVHRVVPPDAGAPPSPWLGSWSGATAAFVLWGGSGGSYPGGHLLVDTWQIERWADRPVEGGRSRRSASTSEGVVDEAGLGWRANRTLLPDGHSVTDLQLWPRWASGAAVAIPHHPGSDGVTMDGCVPGDRPRLGTADHALWVGTDGEAFFAMDLTAELDAAFGVGWKVPFDALED
jgi:hypothetical protein